MSKYQKRILLQKRINKQLEAFVKKVQELNAECELINRENFTENEPIKLYESLCVSENRVLELLAHGFTIAEIADKLCVSRTTISTHLAHIYEKLQIGFDVSKTLMVKQVKAVLFYLKLTGELREDYFVKN